MTRPTPSERRRAELREALPPTSWLRAAAPSADAAAAQARALARRAEARARHALVTPEARKEAARRRALETKPRHEVCLAIAAGACRECGAPLAWRQRVVWLQGVGIFCLDGCARGWGASPDAEVGT